MGWDGMGTDGMPPPAMASRGAQGQPHAKGTPPSNYPHLRKRLMVLAI